MKNHRLMIAVGLLLSSVIIPAHAQNSSSYDFILSILRGKWEYATFDEKITIKFVTDNEVYIHDTLRTYSISNDAFLVEINGEVYAYPFNFDGNTLTVTNPDGIAISYQRKDFGYNEKLLDGSFFSFEDTLCESYFLFKNFHKFRLSVMNDTDSANGRSGNGYFRIEGNDIFLTFSDKTTETAQIRYREEDGTVTGIRYSHRLYDKQFPDIIDPISPLPPPEYPPFPHPPPPPGPDPRPPFYPDPPSPPEKITNPQPTKPADDRKRDDGSIRPKPSQDPPGKKRPKNAG